MAARLSEFGFGFLLDNPTPVNVTSFSVPIP